MKNLKQICVTILLACACIQPTWGGTYCGDTYQCTVNISGQNKEIRFTTTYKLSGGIYTIIFTNGSFNDGGTWRDFYFATDRCYAHQGCQTADWTITDAGRTINKMFNSTPSAPHLSGYYRDGYNNQNFIDFTIPFPAGLDWSSCISDSNNPVISGVTAQSTTQTSITVRVTATDNQANDTGVASITVTRHDNSQSQTENIYPVVKVGSVYRDFVFSGLSAGTTYTFDITVTDAAGRTASTSRNLTTQAAVVDNTPPTISSAAAENIKATTADIRVQATDNIGVTKVVIKNGSTTLKTETFAAATPINRVVSLTGLTKNTTYNLTVYVYDAANNESSTSVSFKTNQVFYYVNSWGWETPYVYLWLSSDDSKKNAAWPGEPIKTTYTQISTTCTSAPVYEIECSGVFDRVKFSNNSSNATNDLVIYEGRFYNPHPNGEYDADEWYYSNNFSLVGTFNSWNAATNPFSAWTSGSTVVSTTVHLGAGSYEFKIRQRDRSGDYGNNGTITRDVNCWFMSPNAGNCHLTTTIESDYTFTYDFAANRLSVAYPPEPGCSGTTGTPTTGSGPQINYSFTYAGGKIYVTAIPTDNAAFDHCYFKYCNNNSGTGEVSVLMALSADKKKATYELTAPYASGTNMYFKFQYKAGTMGSQGESCSGWNSAPTYNIGNCKPEDDIPFMISASQASATTTSVTLNVSGIVNIDGVETATTQYVVSTNGGSNWSSPLTASEGKITVTSLSANTVYTVLVKAYYNGEPSTNTKTVSARTSRESQCSGTGLRHFTQNEGTPVDFDLEYDSSTGNVTITVQPTTPGSDNVTYLQVDYLPAYGGLTSVTTATYSAPAASVTFNPHNHDSRNVEGTDIYFRFLYSINGSGTRWMTAQNLSSEDAHILYYRLGDCPHETESDPPCMNPISANDITPSGTSVTVAVSADDGDQPAPTKFLVSTASTFATSTEYTAAVGAITITGLTPCTDYTYYIAAKDPSGNVSTDNETASCQYQSVTFTTTASMGNLAQGKTATVSHTEDVGKTANYAVDGDRGTRWATGSGHNDVANWIQVDLGSVQVVNSVRIYWENAYSRNYQILFSYDGSNYYSVYHQTTTPSRGNGVNDYQNHPLACPTPTRYVKVQAAANSYAEDHGISIWELEVYGSASCAGLASTPHMLCAQTVSVGADEAVIAVSSVDAETAPQNMKYIVTATSGEAGYKQLTSVYTFSASQYIAGTLKHLKVGGLLPDVPYSLSITAVDAAGTASDNSLPLNFRTAAGGGACTWEDNEKQNCFGSGNWTEGYIVSIENDTPDNTHFTVTITCKDNFTGLAAPYFQRIPNLAGDPCGVVGEQQMNIVVGQERTYSLSVDKSALPDEIDFRFKFAYEAGGVAVTKPIHFDKNATCSSGFVIYHYDDAPTEDAVTSSEASSISDPILYYRHFTPDAFEDVTFPFAIDSVRIYDTGDHQYYKLTAQYKDGTTRAGNFYLRVFPAAGSNGESFTNSWEDGTNALPQKNTAYSIRFPNTEGYYANKYILFHGHPGDIATSLSLGTRPTTDDLYKVYPNPTMKAQNLGVKAYVTTDRSENLYWKEDDATVQAFETYVLASEPTMKVMRRIAAWSEREDIVTSIADVQDAMAIHSCITVYSLTGQKIGEWHDCSFGDAEDALALHGQKGCYILVSEGQTRKMIIQ